MDKKLLQLASENLRIVNVYLGSTKAKFHNDFDPLIPNQQIEGQFKIGAISSDSKTVSDKEGNSQRFIRFKVKASMRYLKGPVSEDVLEDKDLLARQLAAKITATYIAEYLVVNDAEISIDAVKEFGMVNAPHNVWPYWREYCQSTCSRMALPVMVMPLLRLED